MASALKAITNKFKGKRKDEAKNGATMTDREEQPSLQSAIGKKSEKSQDNSCQSSSNSKQQPNPPEAGLSHSSGHKPGETAHKMSHSLDHPGSPDCPSHPPCPRSKSLETSDNKNTPNQQRPSSQQHGLSTTEQAPSSSEALNRRSHEQPSGALQTEHQSTIPATDGETLNPVNSEMPADGATAAGISSSSSTQEPPVVTTTTAAAAAAAATTTGEPQNFTNRATFVDGSPRGHQASTVSSVTARAPAVEPQNPSSNESSVDGVTGAGSASLSSNQESSPAGSASADGESQNPANNESPVDGATAADHTAFSNQEQPAVTNGDSQNPERVAPENGVNSSFLQQLFNTPATTAVPPNEGESSLHSLTSLPTQVEPENTAEDTTTTQETTHREEAVNNYEHFLVLEKIHGNRFLQDKLAIGLDRTCHRVIKTWEHLACTEEINAPLEVRLRCKINSENSCTLMLFDVLTSEFEDKTVKDVIDALTRIKRNDAKKIIIDVYPNAAESSERFTDFSSSPANSKLLIKMATLLDQQSRVNQNWRNLGQQFQLSDERLKEIEYGQSAQVLMQYIYTKKTDLKIGAFYDEVKKLNRKDVLKKMNPYIVEEGSRDKLMKDVIELESDAMRSICVCLNNPNRVLKNWRHLAKSSVLGIPEDIYKDCEPGKLKSPTEALFEWIFAEKDKLTVGQLCSALRKIDRNDLVRDLRGHFEQNSSE